MEVITEDTIRRAIQKKELSYGGFFILEKNHFLTPSAKSFLREKKIKIKNQIDQGAKISKNNYKENFSNKFQNISNYEIEIKHLINLLYFPMISENEISTTQWDFFKKNQQWLISFSENHKCADNFENVDIEIGLISINSRQWLFYVGEIEYQLLKITSCIPVEKEKQWTEWVNYFFSTLIIL